MSVRPCCVNIFKTVDVGPARPTKLRVHIISVWGTQLLGSRSLNFGPCASRGHPELSPVRREPTTTGVCKYPIFDDDK